MVKLKKKLVSSILLLYYLKSLIYIFNYAGVHVLIKGYTCYFNTNDKRKKL